MRLRRRTPSSSSARRRRQADDSPKGSPAFAYRSRRTDEEVNTGRQVPRETETKTAKGLGLFMLQRFGLAVLLVAFVVSAFSALSLSSNARVVTLSGAGTSPFLHNKSAYQATASKLLAGSIWNRNKITVNTDGISRQMLENFPELSSVSITLPLLNKRPIVYVQTSQAALILSAKNGSFLVDTTGKALLNADNLAARNQGNLPVVTDQSGLDVRISHQALASADVGFIQAVVVELSARHVSVSSMVLPPKASELDVHINGQPYVVKFNLESGDARQQAGTFLATQAELRKNHVTPSRYVDVRVDGRAYYK